MQLCIKDYGSVTFKKKLESLAMQVTHECLAHVRGGMPLREWDAAKFCFGACLHENYALDGLLERTAATMMSRKIVGAKNPGGMFTEEGWKALYAGDYVLCARTHICVCLRNVCVCLCVCLCVSGGAC
jgi:hypothetical protein